MFIHFGIIVFISIQGLSNGYEQCQTVTGTQGACISIYQCSPILHLLKQLKDLSPKERMIIKNSQCESEERDNPKVCCPFPMMMSRSPVQNSLPMDSDEADSSAAADDDESVGMIATPPDVTNHPKLRLINNATCGRLSEPKIILGNLTALSEFPWMALLAYSIHGRTTDFQCGGTLINKRYVLTAAHCVVRSNPGTILAGVRIGEYDLRTEIDCQEKEDGGGIVCAHQYQNFFVERFHVHHKYRGKTHENDIALIRMDGDANFDFPNVIPICLPVGETAPITFKTGIVTGWGKTETDSRSEVLLRARLAIVSKEKCAKIYKPNRIRISDKQICAGGTNRMDSCFGDSGGPLQHPYADELGSPVYVQYGLVSFGTTNCGMEGFPGVYTKVSYYMDWILDTIVE